MSSTGPPQSDGDLNNTVKIKIRHYRQVHEDRTDPIVFLSVDVIASGHVCDDFVHLIFLDVHREVSILSGELPEESEKFRPEESEQLATYTLGES